MNAPIEVLSAARSAGLRHLIENRLSLFQATCDQKINDLAQFLSDYIDDLEYRLLAELNCARLPEDEAPDEIIGQQKLVDDTDPTIMMDDDHNGKLEPRLGLEYLMSDSQPDGCHSEPDADEAALVSDSNERLLLHIETLSDQSHHLDTEDNVPNTPSVSVPISAISAQPAASPSQVQQLGKNQRTPSAKHFECDLCQRRFCVKESLRVHMRTHTGERPYMCHLCCRRFKQHAPFRRHMRTHQAQRDHRCAHCDKAFGEKSALRVHMQSHTGERPYKCPKCDRGYSKRYHCRQHLRKFHGVSDVDAVFPPKVREWQNKKGCDAEAGGIVR